MASFKIAQEALRKIEGGWVNDPRDSGGETYAGISRNNWGAWAGWEIIDRYHKQTTNIVKLNQLLDADDRLQLLVDNFYEQHFWNFDQVESQSIANLLFNIDVNTGKGHAVKFLQEGLNNLGIIVAVDGSIGPKTIAATNQQKEADILAQVRVEASLYYHEIVSRNPSQKRFLRGWLNRISV